MRSDRIVRSRRRLRRSLVLALAAWLAGVLPSLAQASEQSLQIGKLHVVVWTPDTAGPGPWPVVVFSHGLYLCANRSRFLTEALAAAGYLVIAPNHADAHCGMLDYDLPDPSRLALKPAAIWTDADYRDRADDIRSLIDALRDDPRLGGEADLSRLALAGHSLGGYTVLGLGGAWPKWRLPGVKAILAFAPYTLPFWRTRGLRRLQAPVLYEAGLLDPVFTPPLLGWTGAYDRSPAPKYYVEIEGASHYAWVDPPGWAEDAIVAYAVAFLDRYLKGAPESPVLRSRQRGVAVFRRDVRRR